MRQQDELKTAWCAPDYSESLDALEIAFDLALRDMERPSRCLWCTIVAGLQNPREGKGGTWFTMLQHPGQKVTSITWPSLDVVLTRRVRPLGRGAYVEVSASTAEGVALASAMLWQLRTLGQPVPPTGHRGDCPGEPVGEPGRPADTAYDWAWRELQRGRSEHEVYDEWRNRPDVADRWQQMADAREAFRSAMKRRNNRGTKPT